VVKLFPAIFTKPIIMLQRKNLFYLPLLLVFILISCSGDDKVSSDGLINIDVLEAFKEKRSMKLSNFVKDVEFIQLKSSKDAYFMNARSFTVGEKYIMIADDGEDRVILFDRQGKFLRHIGRKGKGPGEFNNPWQASMDPTEQFVIIADGIVNKIIKYSVGGEFVKEINTSDIALGRFMDEVRFINDDQFVVVNRRPIRGVDGYASLPLFDIDLNLVKKILPRANDENLCLSTNPHGVLAMGENRMTFWEPFIDTLYTIRPTGEAIPTHVIGFSKGAMTKEYATTPAYGRDPELEPKNSVFSIREFGGYMHITGRSNNEWFGAMYDLKTGDMFQLESGTSCDTSGYFSTRGLENDLYGVDPVSMYEYSGKIDRVISWARPERIAEYYDLDCIRSKKVKYPKLRDRFLEIAEDPEASYQKIIVLMKLK